MQISIVALGSRGDVQPYVAIGRGLRLAGHSVRVVTHAPFESFVRGNGLDFSSLGGDPRLLVASMTDNGVNSRHRVWLPRLLVDARDFIRAGNGMVRAVLGATPEMTENCWRASRDADAMVVATFGALVGIPTARKLGVPALVAHVAPLVRTAEFALPGPLPPAPPWLGSARGWYNLLCGRGTEWFFAHSFEGSYEKAQQVLELPLQSSRQQARELGTPTLFGYSPSLLPRPADWRGDYRVTGYWFLDGGAEWRPPQRLLDFLDAGPPPVYVGFGSMNDRDPEEMSRLVVAALRRARQRGILLTGAALDRDLVTDDVFALDSAPHDWLFPRVAAVVHHGGAGTTGESLRAGRPTVIVPFIADQHFWGQQVYQRGVGPRPLSRRHLSAEILAAAIDAALTDARIVAQAKALGERIRAEDGVRAAAAAVHTALSSTSDVRRWPARRGPDGVAAAPSLRATEPQEARK